MQRFALHAANAMAMHGNVRHDSPPDDTANGYLRVEGNIYDCI